MPSGRTHDCITWFLTPPVFYATWRLTHNAVDAGIAATAFVFAGLMFSGDLDLPSVQYRRWGMVRWIWKPYQWLVPHRSPLSHGVLLGPAVRLAYLTLVVGAAAWGVLAYMAKHGAGLPPIEALSLTLSDVRLGAREWEWLAFLMGGLWVGGASHSAADMLGTFWGRLWRRRRRRR